MNIENARLKLAELSEALKNTKRLIVMTHDNPDPDSLSSALTLAYIIQNLYKIPTKVKYGGIVGRAENRALIRVLNLRVFPITDADYKAGTDFAFVDMQPHTGNSSYTRKKKPIVIIDHHHLRKSTKADFIDIRTDYGATASILTEYLIASGLEITSQLATALCYGISSETQDLGREATEIDVQAYLALMSKSNKKLLASIAHPKLPKEYFATLSYALHHTKVYKNAICTTLGEIDNPDSVAFIADFMLRLERMSWSLCCGRYKEKIIVSIRSSNPKAHAGRLLRSLLAKNGTAGGHGMIAGGQIPCSMEHEQCSQLEITLIANFLKKIGYGEVESMTPLLLAEVS